jgi:hypothetical protein
LLSELVFVAPDARELERFEAGAPDWCVCVIRATATASSPPSERATRLISSAASDCSTVTSS